MITGILNADSGSIKINGLDIKKDPIKAKMQFGYVPDNPDMYIKLKGIEYLNFMADVYEVPSDVRKNRIKSLLERFDLYDAANDLIQSYSHGMKQKIVLVGALINDPSIWILDEPMTGLDPKSSFVLKEMMREHTSQGKTVFFSSHVLEVVEKLCDRIAIINKGKVIFSVDAGDLAPLRFHRFDSHRAAVPDGGPRLRVINLQVLVALGLIILGAVEFVDAVGHLAHSLGVSEVLLALVVAPIATELPEKFNSIIWIRQGKDTLAMGNITGAMVFQSAIPVSVALIFAPESWVAGPGSYLAFASAGIAFLASAAIFLPMWRRARLDGRALLVGGGFYLAYLGVVALEIAGVL
jgi:ABC-2 type transport system ATP-binding protein